MIKVLALVLPFLTPWGGEAAANNPEQARVLYVIDGDTLEVALLPSRQKTRVRLRDIDAPEIKGRCAAETRRAAQARSALVALLPRGSTIYLSKLSTDRYGRLLADVQLRDGRAVGQILTSRRLAVPWGRGRPDWCRLYHE